MQTNFLLEIQCPALEQHQGVHRSDGAGGGGEGEDVPGDHGGLPDLLGTALPRHPGQLELGVEGRQKVNVSRGDQDGQRIFKEVMRELFKSPSGLPSRCLRPLFCQSSTVCCPPQGLQVLQRIKMNNK